MTIPNYIDNIRRRYKQGNTTEHTFLGDLQQLIESLLPDIRATNEPKRQTCGAPDYILTKRDVPVGFIEAKDIGDDDLDGMSDPTLETRSYQVLTGMTDNPNFLTPTPTIADMSTLIGEFFDALSQCKDGDRLK